MSEAEGTELLLIPCNTRKAFTLIGAELVGTVSTCLLMRGMRGKPHLRCLLHVGIHATAIERHTLGPCHRCQVWL